MPAKAGGNTLILAVGDKIKASRKRRSRGANASVRTLALPLAAIERPPAQMRAGRS